MVAKISPRHRQAFLEVLAATGNYALAADQVRVSRDWAFRLRRRDKAFDAACRAAVAAFRNSPAPSTFTDSGAGPLHHPGSGPGRSPSPPLRGKEELLLQRGNGRRVQVKRARPDQWTLETARRFLMALAGTCNVRMAAEAIGTSAASAQARRRLDPGFARAWEQALEIGYTRLEWNLIEAACCFFEGEVVPQDNPIRTMSVAEAIQSLNRNVRKVKG